MRSVMYRPNRSLDRMINDMFNGFRFDSVANPRSCDCYSPRVDIRENADAISLTFELPGMSKEDIKVTIKDDILSVSGVRTVAMDAEKEKFLQSEILSGEFCRTFTLPDTVNTDEVKADYKAGLLTITLAKQEAAKPKEIAVSVE